MKFHHSPPSPVSSSSSSIHSTISSHSLSSNSSATPTTTTTTTTTTTASSAPSRGRGRCEGLDLLVKAVYHVAGSVVGVPYIQRRVIRRRKPALRFDKLMITPFDHPQFHQSADDIDGEVIVNDFVMKQRKTSKVVPLIAKDRRKSKSSKN